MMREIKTDVAGVAAQFSPLDLLFEIFIFVNFLNI